MSPSAMIFTEDCMKICVANEGTPYEDIEGNKIDPEGTISIINLDQDPPELHIHDFAKFNDRWVPLYHL